MNDGLDFELDIQQRLRGGSAVTELERVESAFTDVMKRYDQFEKASNDVTKALEKNADATESVRVAMARAMADGNEKKFWQLAQKIDDLGAEEEKLKKKAEETSRALAKETQATQRMASRFGALKKAETAEDKASELAKKHHDQHTKTIVKLTGRLGESAEKVEGMVDKFGGLGFAAIAGAGAMAAVAAAVILVTAAFASGYIALAKYGLEMSNFRRNQEQTLRAMTQSNEGAKQQNDAFLKISAGTGIAEDRLLDMTKQLTVSRQQMGLAALSGNQLEKAVYSLAEQEQALGDSSGTGLLIDQLNAGVYSVDQLGSRMDRKFGDVLQHKMLGLDQQFGTLHKNIDGLFSGLNIDGFLRGFSRIVALTDQSTVSGRVLKGIVESIFGPATGDLADAFFIKVEKAILDTEGDVLDLQRFFQNLGATWDDISKRLDATPLKPIKDGFEDLLKPLGKATTWIDTFVNTLANVVNPLHALREVTQLLEKIQSMGLTSGQDSKALGKNYATGIAQGLNSGSWSILDEATKLATGTTTAVAKAWDSHSPSRVAERLGKTYPEGLERGVSGGMTSVASAVDDLLSAPKVSQQTTNSKSATQIGPFYTTIEGGADDEDIDEFEKKMNAVFRRLALGMGVPE